MTAARVVFMLSLMLGATPLAHAQTTGQVPTTPGQTQEPERRVTTNPPGTPTDGLWAVSLSVFEGADGSNADALQDVAGVRSLTRMLAPVCAPDEIEVPRSEERRVGKECA